MKKLLVGRIAYRASALLLAMTFGSSSQAGPFGDCCFNNTPSTYYPYGVAPVPITSGYGTYPYNAYTGYPNTSYSPILPAGLPQANYALLPTGGYASQYYRAPTTYYRPVTTLDPNTGTTVTSLQPCASYQYQAQRVPLLVPSWSNYAYGGYGASTLQNRWSPITAPSMGGSGGQSTLSIASGFGNYGTSPVVQVPSTGAVLSTVPTLPTSQPITSGYGGIYYAQPNIIGTGSAVVPAAAWTVPAQPQYSPAPLNGAAYSSPNGGYFGSIPQTFVQPATMTPPVSTTISGFAPSGPATTVNGVTITPIGPPTTSSYPTGSIGTSATNAWTPSPSTMTNPSSQSMLPNASIGTMPGSMGQPVMPSAVSPNIDASNFPVYPPVMPSTPAPSSSWSPSPASSSTLNDRESTVAPSLNPSVTDIDKPEGSSLDERPRFQLRSVERSASEANSYNDKPTSPWANQDNSTTNGSVPSDKSKDAGSEPELKLNMESLRPIPAPQNFDASPDWKPALLNVRDQTAEIDSTIRGIDRQPSDANAYREVRFLNSIRATEPVPNGTLFNDGNVKAILRPIQKSNLPIHASPAPAVDRSLETSGWSTVSGR